jgi:thiamine biosynthesis lipoprotein
MDGMSTASGPFRHVEHVMGTVISFDVRGETARPQMLDGAIEWLHHVDRTYSTYRDDSVVSRFARGELAVDDLDQEVQDVLLRCIALGEETHGAFDAFAVPAPNGTRLDPSGYVKGWAVERAVDMLAGAGVTDMCVNAGGDIAVRGERRPGEAWRIGIRHPADPLAVVAVVSLRGRGAVATSGTYERGAHIVDPRTGEAATGIASATVIGVDLGVTDAYATAAFVMGRDALGWMAERPGHAVVLVTHEGEVLRGQASPSRWSSLTNR